MDSGEIELYEYIKMQKSDKTTAKIPPSFAGTRPLKKGERILKRAYV